MIEEEFKNKLSYLNIVNDYNEDEQPMKKNNNLKKKDTDKNSSKENEKNKLNDELKNTLFESEQQKLNFKKQIIKKKKNKIKDVNFLLKYSSNTDQQSFVKFYNNCKGISDNLILMKNTEGKKYGLFSKNIFDLLNGDKPRDSNLVKNYFAGYSFNSHEFYEFNVKHYFDIYTGFIQSIYNFFSNEDASYQNRRNQFPDRYPQGRVSRRGLSTQPPSAVQQPPHIVPNSKGSNLGTGIQTRRRALVRNNAHSISGPPHGSPSDRDHWPWQEHHQNRQDRWQWHTRYWSPKPHSPPS